MLKFQSHKFYCYCCRRYSNQRFGGIRSYQRPTKFLLKQLFHQHGDGICQKILVSQFKLGKETIERWHLTQTIREDKETITTPCPRVLGIDEYSFSKKQGFVTTLCNLRHH